MEIVRKPLRAIEDWTLPNRVSAHILMGSQGRLATTTFMKKLLLIALLAAVAAFLPAAGASAAAPAQQRVIAELNLAPGATAEQISAATDALLASLPAGSYSLNNRYSTLPYVALSAGSDALSVLQHSGLVANVYSDGVVTAASKPGKKCKKSKKSKHAKKACKKNGTTQKGV
jgi:hypothetical protein